MRIAGERADGALYLSLGGGLAVVLKGTRVTPTVDELAVEKMGPWRPANNSLEHRRAAARALELARVGSMDYFRLGDRGNYPEGKYPNEAGGEGGADKGGADTPRQGFLGKIKDKIKGAANVAKEVLKGIGEGAAAHHAEKEQQEAEIAAGSIGKSARATIEKAVKPAVDAKGRPTRDEKGREVTYYDSDPNAPTLEERMADMDRDTARMKADSAAHAERKKKYGGGGSRVRVRGFSHIPDSVIDLAAQRLLAGDPISDEEILWLADAYDVQPDNDYVLAINGEYHLVVGERSIKGPIPHGFPVRAAADFMDDDDKETIKEKVKGEVKDEVKGEVKGEVKDEVKAEVKDEIKGEVKDEAVSDVAQTVKEEVTKGPAPVEEDVLNLPGAPLKALDAMPPLNAPPTVSDERKKKRAELKTKVKEAFKSKRRVSDVLEDDEISDDDLYEMAKLLGITLDETPSAVRLVDNSIKYSRLLASTTAAKHLAGGEHPFSYCMENVIPSMEEEGKGPDDPEAFCAWWKNEGPGSE